MLRTYDEYKNLVDRGLTDLLPYGGSEAEILYDSMKYSLKAGGKRLRPVLLLAALELAGGKAEDGIAFATASEYIHTYSLIHDDLPAMDDDDLRRGKPTNHKVYGEGIAILAGDGLLSSAFQIMADDIAGEEESGDSSLLKGKISAFQDIATGAGVQGMVAGQTADLTSEGKDISEDAINYIHLNKTAALITACIRAGAHIGGADGELVEALTVYGKNLGLAFQIADDILDVEGSEEELGKDIGSDEDENKNTFVNIFGIAAAREQLDKRTAAAIEALEEIPEDVSFFRNLAMDLAERRN